ncbi:unnamed protein product [Pleuronectes platessa]|uniref:Uncharacterized protein n=1 Tax=Pleuronectes platessa TaxID=8262 RepID=A0A9N7Y8B0_PLEPL|nr:unnamed protein product [Pleuronectes platessa]
MGIGGDDSEVPAAHGSSSTQRLKVARWKATGPGLVHRPPPAPPLGNETSQFTPCPFSLPGASTLMFPRLTPNNQPARNRKPQSELRLRTSPRPWSGSPLQFRFPGDTLAFFTRKARGMFAHSRPGGFGARFGERAEKTLGKRGKETPTFAGKVSVSPSSPPSCPAHLHLLHSNTPFLGVLALFPRSSVEILKQNNTTTQHNTTTRQGKVSVLQSFLCSLYLHLYSPFRFKVWGNGGIDKKRKKVQRECYSYSKGLRAEPHGLEVTGWRRAEVSEERRGAGAVNERREAAEGERASEQRQQGTSHRFNLIHNLISALLLPTVIPVSLFSAFL